MSPTHSPLQFYSLFKSCMIFFIVQAIIVFLFFQEIWHSPIGYRLLMLLINITVSIVIGWRFYKQRYHLVFSYDDEGFMLRQGSKEETSRKWSEFSVVSLARTEYGDFSIRLQNGDSFDIPVSKLKINPFNFRSEVTKLVEAHQKKS